MARDRLAGMRNNARPDYEENTRQPPAYPAPATRRPPPGGLPTAPGRRQPDRGRARSSSPSSFEDNEKDYTRPPPAPRRPPAPRDPFADQPPMEMSAMRTRGRQTGPREVSDTAEFFDAIAALQTDLKELQFLIESVGDLSRRGLDSTAPEDRATAQEEAAELANETKAAIQTLKTQIQGFEADHSLLAQRGDPEGNLNVRTQQLAGLKKRFVETVQRYAEVEQNSRKAIKARVERQVRIVKPNATDEEIRMAVEDETHGGAAVFQQALVSSNRMGSARNALKEVQSRAEDMRRIEETITELAQLFNDMATMVEEQDVAVQHIEKQAEVIETDVEAAREELKTAVVSAKGARSKRKCCCVILVLILLLVGGGVAVYILMKNGIIPGLGAKAGGADNATSTRPTRL